MRLPALSWVKRGYFVKLISVAEQNKPTDEL